VTVPLIGRNSEGKAVAVDVTTTDVESKGTVVTGRGETLGFFTSQIVPSRSASSFLLARYNEAVTLGFTACFLAFAALIATPVGYTFLN
jgi:hypothetical protein